MNWKFWKKKKERIVYRGLTEKQFIKIVSGNVLGVIWTSKKYNNLSEDQVSKFIKNHKHMTFAVGGAYIETIPCVCLYYEYVDNVSYFHMIFTHPIKESLVIGNSFSEEDLIFKTKENEHLLEQAIIQYDINNEEDVEQREP